MTYLDQYRLHNELLMKKAKSRAAKMQKVKFEDSNLHDVAWLWKVSVTKLYNAGITTQAELFKTSISKFQAITWNNPLTNKAFAEFKDWYVTRANKKKLAQVTDKPLSKVEKNEVKVIKEKLNSKK